MQFRTVKANLKGGPRLYGQLVESYRRQSDGMPLHRVIASLGQVTEEQAAVFKLAFQASRTGAGVQVIDAGALDALTPVAEWSRDWLDVVACFQAWHDSGLAAMVRGLFAGHQEEVDPADIVAALVVQRCVAPASKLAACDWFADTALPELLGVAPERFHNSRVHRVLERLEQVDADLQCALTERLRNAAGQACKAVFVDCTDTWFVGNGPDMAQRGKTKEEFYREKIGIVLVCRQDGMPLRFKVLRGNTEDGGAMLEQLATLADAAWLAGVPVVADRALGNTSDLLEMSAQDLLFVTALCASEHAAYGAVLDCPALHDVDAEDPQALERAGAAVVQAGLTRHAPDLYVQDKSVVQRDFADRAAAQSALGADGGGKRAGYRRGDDLARDMLAQARRYKGAVATGKVPSFQALQRGLGRSNGHMDRILALLKLPADVQARIDAGHAKNLTKRAIEALCKGRDHDEHRSRFDQLRAAAQPKYRDDRRQLAAPNEQRQPWVEIVVAFNPVMWQAKRRRAQARHDRLVQKVELINQRMNRERQPLSLAAATATLSGLLRDAKATKLYTVTQVELLPGRISLALERNESVWRVQRARDGVLVVASSPRLDMAAVERVRLYRSKDHIEKDFRDLKSVLELRPVWHRTDAKVKAHVALCVLALAVQRWIGQRLIKAGRTESAERALAELRNVRLIGQRLPNASKIIPQPNGTTAARQQLAAALEVDWALRGATTSGRLQQVR